MKALPDRAFAFFADRVTFTDPEQPILVIDLTTSRAERFASSCKS